jgi:hypothetical protein
MKCGLRDVEPCWAQCLSTSWSGPSASGLDNLRDITTHKSQVLVIRVHLYNTSISLRYTQSNRSHIQTSK